MSPSIDSLSSPIGLVAGSGTLPFEFIKAAKSRKLKTVVVAHIGETDPAIEALADECSWIKLGQLGKLIKRLQSSGVKQVAFAGGISRARIFSGFWPDLRGVKVIARVGSLRDDLILRGIAQEIESAGITVIAPAALLDRLLPTAGLLTTKDLNSAEHADAVLGWTLLKAIGPWDVGQAVIVTKGVVSAIEAVEGTDSAVERAGLLAGPGGVLIKISKPQQDLRLDMPTVGTGTIAAMVKAQARGLVLEAGKTLILDPAAVIQAANLAGISIRVFDKL